MNHQMYNRMNNNLRNPQTEMTDKVLATIVEEVKNDVLSVSKPKRTRRTKAKQEEEQQVFNVEPEPVNQTAPTVPVVEPAPIVAILDESDVVSTRTDRPDKKKPALHVVRFYP
jgi:hypothetical protein